MVEVNHLDKLGLYQIGIGFEQRSDMEEFIKIIQEELETRTGQAICQRLNPSQLKDFESLVSEPMDLHKNVDWFKKNCPEYREICQDIRMEIKEELIQYRKNILGVLDDPNLEWNSRPIECIMGQKRKNRRLMMYRDEYIKLKEVGIITVGELYYSGRDYLDEIMGCSYYSRIHFVLDEYRENKGL